MKFADRKKIYLDFIIGTGVLAFGMYNIHSRAAISEGGVLGLTLLLQYWLHISPAISAFILDTTFFALGSFVLQKGFIWQSLICTSMYSIWYRICELTGPVLPDLTDYPLIAAIAGGLCVGFGVGQVVKHDVACGGDDAYALVFNKLFGIKLTTIYQLSDITILLFSLTYIPFRRIFYSLISVYLSGWIVGYYHRKAEKKEA